MSKHTPVPWSTNGIFVWSTSDKKVIKDRGENCSIEVFGDTWDEQQANAQLIAAAPELLEALKSLLEVSDFISENFPGAGWRMSQHKARAAIKKAEGKA